MFENGEYVKNINCGITPFDITISDKRKGYVSRNYFVGENPFMKEYFRSCIVYNYQLYLYLQPFIPKLTEEQIRKKEYYKQNSNKEISRSSNWYNTHKDEIKEKPSWRSLNPERAKENDKIYYTTNRDRILAYAAIRREEHRDESREYFRNHYAENKKEICLSRKKNRQEIYNSWVNRPPFNGVCFKCGKKVNYDCEDDMPEFHHTKPENKTGTLYNIIVNLNSPDEVIWKEINDGGVVLLCSKCHKLETIAQQSVPENIKNKIIEMYESGKMIKDISDSVGYERHTISKVIKSVYPEANLKYSLPPNKIEEAKTMYNDGIGICEIAKKFNVNRKTMGAILNK